MINKFGELYNGVNKNKAGFNTLKKNIYMFTKKNDEHNKVVDDSHYKKEIKEHISKLKSIIFDSIFIKNFSIENIFYNNLFNSSSSSITRLPLCEDKYIVNTRLINYKLNDIGKSNNNENKCISVNKIDILDKNFNIIKSKYLFPKDLNKIYIGIEDVRLFNMNDKIYYIGSYYNKVNKKIQIVSNIFNVNGDFNLRMINPSFNTDFNWEKNWVFFDNFGDLNIIYKWNPIYICKIDYENNKLNLVKTIENLPNIFSKFRGSTNGLHYDNKIWFIVHQQNQIQGGFKSYEHNIVVFDKDMNLLGYSNNLKFEQFLVEFCIGMEITYNNNFVITYSTLDSTSKLAVFTPEYINSLIQYI